MPTILAIETSADFASVAVLRGEQQFVLEAERGKTHSEAILPLLQAVLKQAELVLVECDALAFGSGPGSFTGVRTAAGVIQGLAFASGRPVVAVVTLQAMAQACRQQTGADTVLTVLDARMGEVYWAQYRYADGWHEMIAPTLSAPSVVEGLVQAQGVVQACGNGVPLLAAAGMTFTTENCSGILPHALSIAQLARLAYLRGETLSAQEAQPLYLRNKVALTTVERLAKAGVLV